MKNAKSALRQAAARVESLELRSMFSGEIDHSMGANGLVNFHTNGGAAIIGDAIAVQTDGKTVVAGHLASTPTTAVIARFNVNGSPDTGFGNHGFTTVPGVRAYNTRDVNILNNGKIFISGQYYIRLTSGGQYDTSFSGDGIQASSLANNRIGDSLALADGSFFELSTGTAESADGFSHDKLTKYKADGTIDKSFATSGRFDIGPFGNEFSGGVAVDGAGRVFISFNSPSPELGGRYNMLRLTPAGKLDTSYGTNGHAIGEPSRLEVSHFLTVLKDGRTLFPTRFEEPHIYHNDVSGFSADGKKEIGLGLSDGGGQFFSYKVTQAADGSIFVGGRNNEGLNEEDGYTGLSFAAVEHFTADFKLDTKYSADRDGIGGFGLANQYTGYQDFAVNAAGQILLLGQGGSSFSSDPTRSDFVRLTAPGTPAHTYVSVSGAVLTINGSAANDHIVAYHVDSEGNPDNTGTNQTVVRFDDDGTLISADAAYFNDAYNGDNPATPFFTKIVVNLGDGNDSFDGSGLDVPVLVHGNGGNDKITGTVLNDSLYGDAGQDTIFGHGGQDTIVV